LFKEQCTVEQKDDSTESKAVAKPNKEVSSDSLQNPSDPDAGYSNHKGKGYQVQVVENYTQANDSEEENKELSLITHVAVESADKHDANALLPAIEDLKKRDVKPKELLADSLYGSTSNCDKAKREHGVEVVAPLMPGNQKYFHLSKFMLDAHGRITSCPCGIAPKSVKPTKNGFSAAFVSESCLCCECFDRCPVKRGAKACYYRYSTEDVCLAGRKRYQESSAFQDRYRYRAGVEATMSEYDRRTGVKHLRVRGMKAVCFAAIMKAIGLNIFRATRYRRHQNLTKTPQSSTMHAFKSLVEHFKDQILRPIQLLSAR
jgi:hypothetical protein